MTVSRPPLMRSMTAMSSATLIGSCKGKSKADIDAFKSASKPVYEDYKKNAGSLGSQLLEAASKL